MYLNLSFLANNVYKSWVALVSSIFLNAINYFIFKIFWEDQSILVERIFENERSWNWYYLVVAI